MGIGKQAALLFSFFVILMLASQGWAEHEEIEAKYGDLEQYLIPLDSSGKVDYTSMEVQDHQYLAYCLKAEARLKNQNRIIDLTQYLVDHSDDNNDGEIGWGLGYEWDAFGDGTVNPKGHVYAIETVNVMEAYMEALESGALTAAVTDVVQSQLQTTALLWNRKYWTEYKDSGERCYYWYSISENDNIACLNIDAKMVGVQAKLLNRYAFLFNDEERCLIYDHIDRCMAKILQRGSFSDGYIVWSYLERQDSGQNDVIHHAFILEGINDYLVYRYGGRGLPEDDKVYRGYIARCVDGNNNLYSSAEHVARRCFDTGAIRWLSDRSLQKQVIITSYNTYMNEDTDCRQLAFLLDAMSYYLSVP